MKIIDLFCGAGGESTGIIKALNSNKSKYDLVAINHWDIAIDTHKKNHPEARHYCEPIQKVNPLDVFGAKDKINLLWASPECTHHSIARGGRPMKEQSRSTWLILKWLSELYVENVIIENVKEFVNWGPLGRDGRPLQSKKGKTFDAFVATLNAMGYKTEWRLLTAANYGDPTTRRRFFLQATRSRTKKITWPEPTHSEKKTLFTKSTWNTAEQIIDWDIKGKSIFDRPKPLAAATLRRIENGIKKYWGNYAEPFLIILRGTGTSRSIKKPLPAITTSGSHVALIKPFITSIGQTGSKNRMREIERPLPTVCTKQEHCLVEPFIIPYYGNGEAVGLNKPLQTVTTHDRFALINGNKFNLDISFRMLQPRELARAQGFPDNYIFSGNKTQQVKQIGNAVPVNMAEALACCAL